MRLTLNNIAKIEYADVELNGVTVIAGANDTGKSTVGKVLYSIFNSLYDIEAKVLNEKRRSIDRALMPLGARYFLMNDDTIGEELGDRILHRLGEYSDDKGLVIEDINSFAVNRMQEVSDDTLAKVAESILEIAKISDSEIHRRVVANRLHAEFNRQVNNVYTNETGDIDLCIQGRHTSLVIEEDDVSRMSIGHSLETEVVYIDDPFVLDGARPYRTERVSLGHKNHLHGKLNYPSTRGNVVDEIISRAKVESAMGKLDDVCSGDFIWKGSNLRYRKTGTKKDLDVRNVSTGLKTFAIIKILLENGALTSGGVFVLDEPEIHLHPEWQLVFAEIIVLLQKAFDMHVLLNTHSPYFLNAIEVYSQKYGICDRCRYYLAEDRGLTSVLVDVTDNLESVYATLATPFQTLEDEAYANE